MYHNYKKSNPLSESQSKFFKDMVLKWRKKYYTANELKYVYKYLEEYPLHTIIINDFKDYKNCKVLQSIQSVQEASYMRDLENFLQNRIQDYNIPKSLSINIENFIKSEKYSTNNKLA